MQESSTRHDLSLVHFPSVPSPETFPLCKNIDKSTLEDLVACASSGCDVCQLRNIAIRLFKDWDGTDFVDRSTSVVCRGPIMTVGNTHHSEFLHNSIQVYTRAGEVELPSSIIGVGREISCRKDSFSTVVSEWLRVCRETHPHCPSITDVPFPTRLLDVGTLESASIQLRTTAGQIGQYLALSHCWGGGIAIRTVRDNIQDRTKCILNTDLPPTFRDAVRVTRALGFRFLWIDALCIIQDDADDWEKESGNMAAIYEKATIVLGASMSPHSNVSFLEEKEACYRTKDAVTLTHRIGYTPGTPIAKVGRENSIVYARILDSPLHSKPDRVSPDEKEPLSRRAWTVQEQLLASRMVYFATEELFWECHSAMLCECMEQDDHYLSPHNQKIPQGSTLLNLKFPSSLTHDGFQRWYRIVDDVFSRDITKQEDILPCLSGLAQRFQNAGSGKYLAGLWLDDLLTGLLWGVLLGCYRVTPYRGPSWSWVSIASNRGVSLFRAHDIMTNSARIKTACAKILEANCSPKGKDPLGAVADGYIKLAAPLVEVVCSKKQNPVPSYRIFLELANPKEPSSREIATLDIENGVVFDEVLYVVLIAELSCPQNEYYRSKDPSPLCGLVLRKRPDVSSMTFERVGIIEFHFERKRLFFDGVEDSILVII